MILAKMNEEHEVALQEQEEDFSTTKKGIVQNKITSSCWGVICWRVLWLSKFCITCFSTVKVDS